MARPKGWLAVLAAATLSLSLGLARLELRTDGAALYPLGDAAVERCQLDRRKFLEPERVVLLLRVRPDGPRLDSIGGLRRMRELHEALESFPGIDVEALRSLATVMDPSPGQTVSEIPDQLDTLPRNELELAERLRRIAESPHGNGLYSSADGAAAAFYVPLLADQERTEFVTRLEGWIDEHAPADFELLLTGPVAAEVTLGRAVVHDLRRLVPASILVIALLLFAALRSVGALLVVMTEVLVVLLWTLGLMGWSAIPVTLVTTILPIVLLTMAVTDEVHLLDRFRLHLESGADAREAIARAMRELARPIVLTSVTTAASLLSFVSTSVVPLRHFGLFAACGVLVAMFLSFTLVPALVITLPRGLFETFRIPRRVLRLGALHSRVLGRGSALLAGALVLLAAPGLARIQLRDSWMDNLRADSELVRATRAFDEAFWGSYRYDVVLRSPELAFFQFPTGLGVVEDVVEILRAAPNVGGIVSHLDAHEVHAAVDGQPLPVSALPRDVVQHFSNDLMRIQRRIDLAHFMSADGRSARVRLFVRDADFASTTRLEDFIDRRLPPQLAGSDVTYHHSGDLAAAQATVRAVVTNMLRSTAWTLLAVALLLTLILRSWRRAALCLLPIVSGIVVLLGAMGWLDVPLGIATGMFAALTLGVGVDFSLHALHTYESERERGAKHRPALDATLGRAGRAILWSTVVLAAGLAVLGLSDLPPNRRLGLLLAGGMLICCAMTWLWLPWPFEAQFRRRARR